MYTRGGGLVKVHNSWRGGGGKCARCVVQKYHIQKTHKQKESAVLVF